MNDNNNTSTDTINTTEVVISPLPPLPPDDKNIPLLETNVLQNGTVMNIKTETEKERINNLSFIGYCTETSLHGWKYISKSNNYERFCWFSCLLCAVTTAFILVYRAIEDFSSQSVTTNMDSLSTKFDDIYFPAITVCNMNNLKKSVLMKHGIDHDRKLMNMFDKYTNIGMEVEFTPLEKVKYNNYSEKIFKSSLKTKLTHKCHNMFLGYSWKNREKDHSTMHYVQTTDESLCCQIFPGILPQENDGNFDPSNISFWFNSDNPWQQLFDGYKTGIKPGKQGVKVLIDTETFEYFSSHSGGAEGVLVLIQHYRDVPLMRRESFIVSPGSFADVGLSVTEITTTQNAIDRFSPTERDCFTADEVNLASLPLAKGIYLFFRGLLFYKAGLDAHFLFIYFITR